MDILIAITLPFLGTTLGALMVFFIKEELDERLDLAFMMKLYLDEIMANL